MIINNNTFLKQFFVIWVQFFHSKDIVKENINHRRRSSLLAEAEKKGKGQISTRCNVSKALKDSKGEFFKNLTFLRGTNHCLLLEPD